jgi:alpha-tubulin suppressor-like RCC1 family protein
MPAARQVFDLGDVIAIAAGSGFRDHSLALRSNGGVWAWGANDMGQLGDGTLIDRTSPVVPGCEALGYLSDAVIAISAGNAFSLALLFDGTVWAWGNNSTGQLGGGDRSPYISCPTPVDGLDNIAVISAGYYHCLALKADGTVWAWGANNHGQLGTESKDNHLTPIQVPKIDDAIGIAAGGYHSLILRTAQS